MRRSSERVCQGCVVSTGSKISNTFFQFAGRSFSVGSPPKVARHGIFLFSLSFTARARGLVTFFGRNFTLERSRGTICISIKVENSKCCPSEMVSQYCVVINGSKTLNLFPSMHTRKFLTRVHVNVVLFQGMLLFHISAHQRVSS